MLVDALGHTTYLLIALSYFVRDIMWLRTVAIIASFSSIAFSYLAPEEPLWLVINWNVIFLAVNGHRLAVFVLEKRRVSFTEEESILANTFFRSLGRVEIERLLRHAEWCDAPAGTCLVRQGEVVQDIILVVQGEIEVKIDGVGKKQRGALSLVGEISYLCGEPASATVTTATPVRYLRWPQSRFRTLLLANPSLHIALQQIIGRDLSQKVTRQDVVRVHA